jgi:hypothetical protein
MATSDDFAGTGALSASWLTWDTNTLARSSGQVPSGATTAAWGMATRLDTYASGANQSAQVLSVKAGFYTILFLKVTNPGGSYSGYAANWASPSFGQFFRVDSGSATFIGNVSTIPSDGQTIKFDWSSGGNMAFSVNGTGAGSVSDGTYTDGVPGFGCYNNSGTPTDVIVDDWAGTGESAATVDVPAPCLQPQARASGRHLTY